MYICIWMCRWAPRVCLAMAFQKGMAVSGISVREEVRGYDPEAVYDNVLVREGSERKEYNERKEEYTEQMNLKRTMQK